MFCYTISPFFTLGKKNKNVFYTIKLINKMYCPIRKMMCFKTIKMYICVLFISKHLVRMYAMYTMNQANVMILRKIRKTYPLNLFEKYFSSCSTFFHAFFLVVRLSLYFGLVWQSVVEGGSGKKQEQTCSHYSKPTINVVL
jgi:hypothetical protein